MQPGTEHPREPLANTLQKIIIEKEFSLFFK